MTSLFGSPRVGLAEQGPGRPTLPSLLRQAIVDLRAEYPDFALREIATICYVRFGRRPSPHTIKRVLADGPAPTRRGKAARRYPPYAQIPDPAEARLAIVRLHAEGWSVTTIARYLATSRPTVYAVLRRWVEEGVRGLDDKSHARPPGARKVTLHAVRTVRDLQQNPELGAFRVHAALKQLGIRLSVRTCGRILALNRALYGLGKPTRAPHTPKEMPFKAERRHQYWTTDVRYLDHPTLGRSYIIMILENYSRAVVASALSRTQDLQAYLMVLYAAVRQHGAPEALVSDGGSIFRAKQAQAIYTALGISKEEIARRQPWQSYIETQFNAQRRMADFHFAQAQTWQDLLDAHDQWVADFNFQVHWAHRDRQDQRQSPAEVLGWVNGRVYAPEQLDRIFYATRFGRRLDRAGYVRFRHWRLYGEEGLRGRRAAVWLFKETLTVEFAEESLSQFAVQYQPDRKHLREVTRPQRFETRYRSPQLALWAEGEVEWRLVIRRPGYQPRTRRYANDFHVRQKSLFA
jgi:transposase